MSIYEQNTEYRMCKTVKCC